MIGCQQEVIKIGFIGDLSSERSQLAVDARNATQLYISNLNEEGGINGRKIELIIKDDGSDINVAKMKYQEFIDEDVEYIIGHMTSDMALPIIDAAELPLLFISPSISTDKMTGLDDNFIRTSPVNSQQAVILKDYCHKNNINNIVITYDSNNEEYTKNLHDYFKEIYETDGYKVNKTVIFDSLTDDLDVVSKTIIEAEPDAVFMISQATSTAFISQSLKRHNPDVELLSVSWSMTQDLITHGGTAVEGCKFIGIYRPDTTSEAYNTFADYYSQVYGNQPTFIAAITTDALIALTEALAKTNAISIEETKAALLDSKIKGLQEDFTIDSFGDNNKRYMLYELINGEFVPIRGW